MRLRSEAQHKLIPGQRGATQWNSTSKQQNKLKLKKKHRERGGYHMGKTEKKKKELGPGSLYMFSIYHHFTNLEYLS